MRGWLAPVLVGLALMGAGPSFGQGASPPVASPILTLDQDRLFLGSLFGRRAIGEVEEASRALIAENREIEARLTTEERDLTTRRRNLPPAEFRKLAEDFDTRVEGIRRAQDTKARALSQQRDQEKQRFLQAAIPILGALTGELGAVAILDKAAIVLAFERIDITDEAIRRIDAALGDGSAAVTPADRAVAPEAVAPPGGN